MNYTRRDWRCEECGRSGFVLLMRSDTDEKAEERRAISHHAQIRGGRRREPACSGERLAWVAPAAPVITP